MGRWWLIPPDIYRCDFMITVRTPPVTLRRRPQTFVHAITCCQILGFLSFGAELMALNHKLPDYILVDFGRVLDLEISRSNMEFAISQPINGLIAMKNISIETYIPNVTIYIPNVTIGFDLVHGLYLKFPRSSMEFAISQPNVVDCQETKSKHRLNSRPQMWPMGLTLVKHGICYILLQNHLFDTKRKWTYWLNTRPPMQPLVLTLVMVTFALDFQGQIFIVKILYIRDRHSKG